MKRRIYADVQRLHVHQRGPNPAVRNGGHARVSLTTEYEKE